MTEDIDLNELERLLREKWHPEAHKPALDQEAISVARKLMDRGNADRLARMRRGERFRYRPVVVTAEYFFVPPHPHLAISGAGWRFDVFENGRRRTSTVGLSEESCLHLASLMSRKGIVVRRVDTEAMKHMAATRPMALSKQAAISERQAQLTRLGSFRA